MRKIEIIQLLSYVIDATYKSKNYFLALKRFMSSVSTYINCTPVCLIYDG